MIGRNVAYMSSFLIFIIITAVASRVSNFPGLVVLRFIQGFFGGPVLSTGGASAQDMFAFNKIPYALSMWAFFAYAGTYPLYTNTTKSTKILTFLPSRTGTWTRTDRVLRPTQHMALVLLRNPYPLRHYLCHPFLLSARNKRRLYPIAARGTPAKGDGRQHSAFAIREPVRE
jgi:hypothetical protein